jgi:N-acylneuraminate cytidylyltransferase
MIAIIPARKGSKSIPGKNKREIAGRPLVSWVIAAALGATSIERVVVTTDDEEVAAIARDLGAAVHDRSPESATDTASTESVIVEVLASEAAEEYVLLQPTSPLTQSADIDGAVTAWREGGFDSLLSVAPQLRFVWGRDSDGTARPINYDVRNRPRRQDASPLLVENGAVYVSTATVLRDHGSRLGGRMGLFEMSEDTYLEVDEPSDWTSIERLLRERLAAAPGPAIRLVLSDVDGVLTDNGMYWSSDGNELKRFSARDGKGFELLHRAGIKTGLITSESAELVARRGAKLGCMHVELGCRDKVATADELRRQLGIEWDEIAFIGDDIHDMPLLEKVGRSFAPRDATAVVRGIVGEIVSSDGGRGAFRDVADVLLTERPRSKS